MQKKIFVNKFQEKNNFLFLSLLFWIIMVHACIDVLDKDDDEDDNYDDGINFSRYGEGNRLLIFCFPSPLLFFFISRFTKFYANIPNSLKRPCNSP